jgi:hypothetical protein
VSDPSESERQRQERAKLVSAFDRRAWQPSEQRQLAPRVLAGGAALVVVAGAVFGVGAVISYNHKKAAEEHAREVALGIHSAPSQNQPASGTPTPSTPSPSATPVPTPSHSQGGRRTASARAGAHNTLPKAAGSGGSGEPMMMAATAQDHGGSGVPRSAKSTAARGALIKNVMTGMCVDIPNYDKGRLDGPVQQFTCDGSAHDNQRWVLDVGQRGAGPNGADLFTIRNTKDGFCFDLPGFDPVESGDVTEWHCDPGSGDNQRWYLERRAKGKYWIRNVSSKGRQCLDVAGVRGDGGPNAKLGIYPCDPKGDHLWSFVS